MYAVGSKVVHPCYGAGIIERIQSKSIGETSHNYYIITTVSKPMKLMVPVGQAESIGLRYVGEENSLRGVLETCSETPAESEIEKDLRTRQANMREGLKSGRFSIVAGVVRKMFFMNNRRPLGTIDRQLFEQGKEFLASELALATDMEVTEAMQEVGTSLLKMLDEEQ